jgi:hypothetical protein
VKFSKNSMSLIDRLSCCCDVGVVDIRTSEMEVKLGQLLGGQGGGGCQVV